MTKDGDKHKIADYWPLISLVILSALVAFCLQYSHSEGLMQWMHYFMGIFLLFFSSLKIFDIKGFVDGFVMYDILAKKVRWYAYCYPFIELFLALSYLSFFAKIFIYLLTIIVMLFGVVGVIFALYEEIDIYCPCMGSVLKVPLSTVTMAENLLMSIMAAVMLFMSY